MNKRKKETLDKHWPYLIVIPILIIITGFSLIFYYYRDTLLKQQEKQLILLAETAANTVEYYINEKIDSFHYYFDFSSTGITMEELPTRIKQRIDLQRSKETYVIDIIYYPLDSLVVSALPFTISESYLKEQIAESIEQNSVIIGPWIQDETGDYSLYIMKTIGIHEDPLGLLIERINLQTIYTLVLSNIKIGNYGYCTVKDQAGMILMHKDKKQIGLDSYYDRLMCYPKLKADQIRTLLDKQLSGSSGSTTIRSYWWGNNETKKVTKLLGYAPIHIGPYTWSLSAIMSYEELARPLMTTLSLLIFFSILILGLFTYFLFRLSRMKHEKQAYEIELQYKEQLAITTNQLRKHEDLLHQSNRIQSIGMFSNQIAHEINNFLTPISIYCELLASQLVDSPDALSDVNEIMEATSHCSSLTKTLLSYSRQQPISLNEVDFNSTQVINHITTVIQSILPRNITLLREITTEPVWLYGTPGHIKQIIMNLCTNAYQAMERCGGTLTIQYTTEHNTATLLIGDTGIGIPPHIMNKMYEPFYSTKEFNKGTGLGLPITMQLVKQLGGTITVESLEGVGTTFQLQFPIHAHNS